MFEEMVFEVISPLVVIFAPVIVPADVIVPLELKAPASVKLPASNVEAAEEAALFVNRYDGDAPIVVNVILLAAVAWN